MRRALFVADLLGTSANARRSFGSLHRQPVLLARRQAVDGMASGRQAHRDEATDRQNSSGRRSRIRVNAGGVVTETFLQTLLRYEGCAFTRMVQEQLQEETGGASSAGGSLTDAAGKQPTELFLDVSPEVFSAVLQLLRTGRIVLPTTDDVLRAAIVDALSEWGLLDVAFPPQRPDEDGGAEGGSGGPTPMPDGSLPLTRLPEVCVVQMCDHMQHDQGVKRHAVNVSYGSDGFRLRTLCKAMRKDLHAQLSSTFWQCYQTHERSMFLITSKVANGTADMMMASLTQRVIEHTETTMGYRLVSSYVTLSPDIKNTNVRMLIHNLIFRRVRQPVLEDVDALQLYSMPDGDISVAVEAAMAAGIGQPPSGGDQRQYAVPRNQEMFANFELPAVGPTAPVEDRPLRVPEDERIGTIWRD